MARAIFTGNVPVARSENPGGIRSDRTPWGLGINRKQQSVLTVAGSSLAGGLGSKETIKVSGAVGITGEAVDTIAVAPVYRTGVTGTNAGSNEASFQTIDSLFSGDAGTTNGSASNLLMGYDKLRAMANDGTTRIFISTTAIYSTTALDRTNSYSFVVSIADLVDIDTDHNGNWAGVTDDGKFYHATIPSGASQNWTLMQTIVTSGIKKLTTDRNGNWAAVGTSGKFFHTADITSATGWSLKQNVGSGTIYGISADRDGKWGACGSSGKLYYTGDITSATGWSNTQTVGTSTIWGIDTDGNGEWRAAGDSAKVYVTDDITTTTGWTNYTAFTYDIRCIGTDRLGTWGMSSERGWLIWTNDISTEDWYRSDGSSTFSTSRYNDYIDFGPGYAILLGYISGSNKNGGARIVLPNGTSTITYSFDAAYSSSDIVIVLSNGTYSSNVAYYVGVAVNDAITAGTLTDYTAVRSSSNVLVTADAEESRPDVSVTVVNSGTATLAVVNTTTDGVSPGSNTQDTYVLSADSSHSPSSVSGTLSNDLSVEDFRTLLRNHIVNGDIGGFENDPTAIGANTYFQSTGSTAQAEATPLTLTITPGTGSDLEAQNSVITIGVDAGTVGTYTSWTAIIEGVTYTQDYSSQANATAQFSEPNTYLLGQSVDSSIVAGDLVIKAAAIGDKANFSFVITLDGTDQTAVQPTVFNTDGSDSGDILVEISGGGLANNVSITSPTSLNRTQLLTLLNTQIAADAGVFIYADGGGDLEFASNEDGTFEMVAVDMVSTSGDMTITPSTKYLGYS